MRIITAQMQFFVFLRIFDPWDPGRPWNQGFWPKMTPKWLKMVPGRVPGGPYRPWLRPHQVWARGDAWGTRSGLFVPKWDPHFNNSRKKLIFFAAYVRAVMERWEFQFELVLWGWKEKEKEVSEYNGEFTKNGRYKKSLYYTLRVNSQWNIL